MKKRILIALVSILISVPTFSWAQEEPVEVKVKTPVGEVEVKKDSPPPPEKIVVVPPPGPEKVVVEKEVSSGGCRCAILPEDSAPPKSFILIPLSFLGLGGLVYVLLRFRRSPNAS